MHRAQAASISRHVQAQNFARLALGHHVERMAAHLQSVVNRWLGTLVSTTRSNACPQNGHWIFPETSIVQSSPVTANRNRYPVIVPG